MIRVVESSYARQDESAVTKNALDSRRGPLLFTHFGFSGPAVLNASRVVTLRPSAGGLSLICDFVPHQTERELVETIQNRTSGEGKLQVATALARILPKRLAESLLRQADVKGETRLAELSRSQLALITRQLKWNRVPISGTLGFKKAEVTAGGIELSQVNSKDMQSKLVPGLFFAGEILDLDGPIGGFNFQAAFSTGWLAGLNA